MTKAELIAKLREFPSTNTHTHSSAEWEGTLDSLGDIIAAELLSGGEVTLPHLGKLKTVRTAARTGRNPKTGAAIDIPAKRKAVLVMGKELKEVLNG